MTPPWGCRFDMLPCHSFGLYWTRVDALVDLVPSAWSGVAGIARTYDSSELGPPAPMVSSCRHNTPARVVPSFTCAVGSTRTVGIKTYPFGVTTVHRGPMDTEHSVHVNGSHTTGAPHQLEHATWHPVSSHAGQPAVS